MKICSGNAARAWVANVQKRGGCILIRLALFCAVAAGTGAKQVNGSVFTGSWGAHDLRVDLRVEQERVTGSFLAQTHTNELSGTIEGSLRSDGKALVAEWRLSIGGDISTFNTLLEISADRSLLAGMRWDDDGYPSSITLRRIEGGRIPDPFEDSFLAEIAAYAATAVPYGSAPPEPAFALELQTAQTVSRGARIAVVHSDFTIEDKNAWIAFYERLDDPDDKYLSYTFLVNLTDRLYDVNAPARPGREYHFRLFHTAGYNSVARSDVLEVK